MTTLLATHQSITQTMRLSKKGCLDYSTSTHGCQREASPGKDATPHAKVQEGRADSWDLHFVLIERSAEHAVQVPQVPPLQDFLHPS